MANDIKNFRIPTDFVLFGSQYKVIYVKDLFERENCYGTADIDERCIRLQSVGKVKKTYVDDNKQNVTVTISITKEILVETFYHELCHIIFDALGEHGISQNEKLINLLGKSFLEIYLSSNYEEKKRR